MAPPYHIRLCSWGRQQSACHQRKIASHCSIWNGALPGQITTGPILRHPRFSLTLSISPICLRRRRNSTCLMIPRYADAPSTIDDTFLDTMLLMLILYHIAICSNFVIAAVYLLDVWSVHISEAFLTHLKDKAPWLIVKFILANCTRSMCVNLIAVSCLIHVYTCCTWYACVMYTVSLIDEPEFPTHAVSFNPWM